MCEEKRRDSYSASLLSVRAMIRWNRKRTGLPIRCWQRQRNPTVSGAPPRIQRYTGQATGQADTAPASVDRVLAGPGRPLDPALQQDMEQRFGHDFSQVRVHSGAAAEQSARDVSANAYTAGLNIVFGAGQFAPETQEGRWLIAHELAHVVQQSGSDTSCAGPLGLPPDSLGLWANEKAHEAQQRAGSYSTTPTVQRQAAAPAPAAATGGLTEEMLKQVARTLHEAMKGWGTDEEAIYSAFSGRTQEQVDAIARVYQEMYRADLLVDLREELTDSGNGASGDLFTACRAGRNGFRAASNSVCRPDSEST